MSDSDHGARWGFIILGFIVLLTFGVWYLSRLMLDADYNGPPPRDTESAP